jgi:hypothetical protein
MHSLQDGTVRHGTVRHGLHLLQVRHVHLTFVRVHAIRPAALQPALPLRQTVTQAPCHVLLAFRVTVPQEQLDCQRLLGRLQVPILGVLAFCGDYNLTFTQLDIRGVHIHTPTLAAKEFSVPWRLALLVFGSSIRARIEGSRVLNNNAGSAFAVANDATAELTGRSLMVNNHAGGRSISLYAHPAGPVTTNGCIVMTWSGCVQRRRAGMHDSQFSLLSILLISCPASWCCFSVWRWCGGA